MKSIIKPLILPLVLAGALLAEDGPKITTQGYANGRWWASNSVSDKINYVAGLKDGLQFMLIYSDLKHDIWKMIYPSGLSNIDLSKEIDKIYEDPANSNVPVPSIAFVAVQVFNGAAPSDMQTLIATLRRQYSPGDGK
jgi:hypothetical protein